MSQITDTLKSIRHIQISPILDANSLLDPSVGIVLVNLEISPLMYDEYEFHFHAARIMPLAPGVPNFVNPHYHLKGVEPYYILKAADAMMTLGVVESNKIVWNEPQKVKPGDFIEVQEKQAHTLINNGQEPLDFAFACPDEHLINNDEKHPEGDRYFTKDLENGIPSWYPKV